MSTECDWGRGRGDCYRPRVCENATGAEFPGSFDHWRGRENRSWLDLERRCSSKEGQGRVFTRVRRETGKE